MQGRSVAQVFAMLVGAVLIAVGILGFLASGSFGTPGEVEPFIVFDVNGWHNLIHLLSGGLLLAVAADARAARAVVIAFGAVYVLVFVLGLIMAPNIFGFIPVNGPDNVLHLVLGAAALGAGFASGETGATPSAGTGPRV